MANTKKGFIGDLPENIIIIGLKKSEVDNGIIIRFLETAGKDIDFSFRLNIDSIIDAYEVTPVEDHISMLKADKGKIMLEIMHYELKTIKILFKQ